MTIQDERHDFLGGNVANLEMESCPIREIELHTKTVESLSCFLYGSAGENLKRRYAVHKFPDIWMLTHSEGKMEDTMSDGMDTETEAGTWRVFAGQWIEDFCRHIFEGGERRVESGERREESDWSRCLRQKESSLNVRLERGRN